MESNNITAELRAACNFTPMTADTVVWLTYYVFVVAIGLVAFLIYFCRNCGCYTPFMIVLSGLACMITMVTEPMKIVGLTCSGAVSYLFGGLFYGINVLGTCYGFFCLVLWFPCIDRLWRKIRPTQPAIRNDEERDAGVVEELAGNPGQPQIGAIHRIVGRLETSV